MSGFSIDLFLPTFLNLWHCALGAGLANTFYWADSKAGLAGVVGTQLL